MPSRYRPDLALALAAFFFGTTFLVVKDAVEDASPSAFLSVRFAIATIALWPLARSRRASPDLIRDGGLAGMALGIGYLTQTVGLQYTTSSVSAFITYLLVLFVPIFATVLFRTRPSNVLVASVALALAGLTLLSGGIDSFGRGEAWTLACAAAFAAHILIVARVSHRHDTFRLTLVQVATVAAMFAVPGALDGGYGFGTSAYLAALYTAVFATAVAFWMQTWAQRSMAPTRAALVLMLEPVFAALLGYADGDRLGVSGAIGALLIASAVVLTETAEPAPAR